MRRCIDQWEVANNLNRQLVKVQSQQPRVTAVAIYWSSPGYFEAAICSAGGPDASEARIRRDTHRVWVN